MRLHAISAPEGVMSRRPRPQGPQDWNRRIGQSALKARLEADYIFHIKPRIEGLLQIGHSAVALSALAFFLRLPRAALRAETGLRLP